MRGGRQAPGRRFLAADFTQDDLPPADLVLMRDILVHYDFATALRAIANVRITRPVSGSVRVAVGGIERVSGWSLAGGGIIAFDDPPPSGALICAGYIFDCPVRFAEDRLDVNRASFAAGEAPSVPLIEIREDRPNDID